MENKLGVLYAKRRNALPWVQEGVLVKVTQDRVQATALDSFRLELSTFKGAKARNDLPTVESLWSISCALRGMSRRAASGHTVVEGAVCCMSYTEAFHNRPLLPSSRAAPKLLRTPPTLLGAALARGQGHVPIGAGAAAATAWHRPVRRFHQSAGSARG